MAVILTDIVAAFRRAQGRCECIKYHHSHEGRCAQPVLWRCRGLRTKHPNLFGVWNIKYLIPPHKGGKNRLDNLRVVCFHCLKHDRNRCKGLIVNNRPLDERKYATIVP